MVPLQPGLESEILQPWMCRNHLSLKGTEPDLRLVTMAPTGMNHGLELNHTKRELQVTAVRGRTWYSSGFDWEREARTSQGLSTVGIVRVGPRTGAALAAGARLGEAQGSAGTGARWCRPGT